jgi:photosystem II stability/assembly factor-like uncharacterized protein
MKFLHLFCAVLLAAASGTKAQVWVRQTAPTTANLYAVHAKDTLNVVAVGDSVVLKTTNGGATWSVARRKGCATCRAFYLNADTAWDLTSITGGNRTTNGWVSWEYSSFGGQSSVRDICFSTAQNGFSAGQMQVVTCGVCVYQRAAVGVTYNGGSSWNSQTVSSVNYTGLEHVACRADADLLLFSNASGELFKSYQQAQDLDTLGSSPLSNSLLALDFMTSATLWVAGKSGLIYSSMDGGGTWIQDSTGTSAHLRGIHFVRTSSGQATGWAVGDSGVILKKTGVPVVVGLSASRNPLPAPNFEGTKQVDAKGRTFPENQRSWVPAFPKPKAGK